MRELLLLRHGKSDWSIDVDDFHRPLKDRGKRGAQRMGGWIQQHSLIPDAIFSSPATRAWVTAEKCSKAMGLTVKDIEDSSELYEASLSNLLSFLAKRTEPFSRVMLVGHNPEMEMLIEWLLGDACPMPDDGKLLPTATLAHIQLPDSWNCLTRGDGQLLNLIRGRQLPKKFRSVSSEGDIFRDRPDYYYTQSAVIPYRKLLGNIEILVIGSSSKKHWGIPKGIVEPGMTSLESARKEAHEEAGITGSIQEEPLGIYHAEKWGGVCTVTVYAMLVEGQLPDNEWEESYRIRKWVSIPEAKEGVKATELRPLIDCLQRRLA